jgi:hypothetical protein
MARRQCDDCKATMGPYEPRTRVGDKMLCDACKDGSRGGMVSKSAAWSQVRHPEPIIHTPGRRPPRPLQTGDSLLWESGHSEPIVGHSESLLMTPGGIKHRRPIEGDHSQSIIGETAEDRADLASKLDIGTPEEQEFLMSNPSGPTKYSTRKVAHDSGDGMTVFHCPFCGSGQVLARSDRTIECQFCHTAFTVQVQPVYPNFPQSIDGQPVQVPGMPGQMGAPGGPPPGSPMEGMDTDPSEPGAPMDPSALGEGGEVPPTGEADAKADDESASGDSSGHEKSKGNPFAKKTYRTSRGAVLDEDDFIRHIAIVTSPDPAATALVIKTSMLNDAAKCPGCGSGLRSGEANCDDCGKDVSGITNQRYPCQTCHGSGNATMDPSGQRTFGCPCCGASGSHDPGEDCYDLDTFAGV